MNAAVRHSTIFRITATGRDALKPAFPPSEDAYCFEEAYRSFIYNDEVELFADLVEFNSMAFLFDGLDVPGFDPAEHDLASSDVVKRGAILEDGSILFNDGSTLPVNAIWATYGLEIPTFTNAFGMR